MHLFSFCGLSRDVQKQSYLSQKKKKKKKKKKKTDSFNHLSHFILRKKLQPLRKKKVTLHDSSYFSHPVEKAMR